jgi:hypothetical protein
MNKKPQKVSESISPCQLGVTGICFEFSVVSFVERFGSRNPLLKFNAELRKAHFQRE